MAALPANVIESQTVQAIYAAYEKKNVYRPSRRLGASIIGKACERAIWFDFRWVTTQSFDGRMLRLFGTGHMEEPRFANDLRSIGCEVVLFDSDTNQQIEFVAVGGHFIDKVDGMVLGLPEAPKTWHTAEFKTHSAKSFASLRSEGLAKSKPEHHAQLMIGMHLSGTDRGLYLAKNKDTDELYAERIHHNKSEGDRLIAKAEQIISATQPPERIAAKPDDFRCNYCSHRTACWKQPDAAPAVAANVNCRTCCHATPVIVDGSNAGVWRCERHGRGLSVPEQIRGCEDHLFIPDLITFAEVTDGGVDEGGIGFVEYAVRDGTTFRNTRAENGYRSIELQQLPAPLVGAGIVDALKTQFGAVVVEGID